MKVKKHALAELTIWIDGKKFKRGISTKDVIKKLEPMYDVRYDEVLGAVKVSNKHNEIIAFLKQIIINMEKGGKWKLR